MGSNRVNAHDPPPLSLTFQSGNESVDGPTPHPGLAGSRFRDVTLGNSQPVWSLRMTRPVLLLQFMFPAEGCPNLHN